MRRKITKRTVDALIAKAIAAGKNQLLRDAELRGCKATPAGNGIYSCTSEAGRGMRSKYATIGDHGTWPPDLAREEAARLLRVIDTGGDPAAERRAEKSAPAVHVFAERFMSEHVETNIARYSTTRSCSPDSIRNNGTSYRRFSPR
jgi:hypothetical protein